MKLLLLLCLQASYTVAIFLTGWVDHVAPLGWQDAYGFHYGIPPYGR